MFGSLFPAASNLVLKYLFLIYIITVGGNLLNRLWVPKKEIRYLTKKFIENWFNGYFVIGIQLRYQYIDDALDTHNFLKCALDIESNQNSSMLFKLKYKGIKWFVTSDNSEVLNRLVNEHPDKIITTYGHIGHTGSDEKAYFRTIMDLELLSNCNELIITGGSTFGYVAAIKSKKFSYYINGGYVRQKMNKCVRDSLSDLSITNTGFSVI